MSLAYRRTALFLLKQAHNLLRAKHVYAAIFHPAYCIYYKTLAMLTPKENKKSCKNLQINFYDLLYALYTYKNK